MSQLILLYVNQKNFSNIEIHIKLGSTEKSHSHLAFQLIFMACQDYMVIEFVINCYSITFVHNYIGAQDYIQPIDSDIWIYSMIHESKPCPSFSPLHLRIQLMIFFKQVLNKMI